jgi:hypothetical protein
MRLHDVYTFQCVCGHEVQAESPVGTCHFCARQFELQWRGRSHEQVVAENQRLIAKAEKREKISRIRERLGVAS